MNKTPDANYFSHATPIFCELYKFKEMPVSNMQLTDKIFTLKSRTLYG